MNRSEIIKSLPSLLESNYQMTLLKKISPKAVTDRKKICLLGGGTVSMMNQKYWDKYQEDGDIWYASKEGTLYLVTLLKSMFNWEGAIIKIFTGGHRIVIEHSQFDGRYLFDNNGVMTGTF